MKKWIMTAAAVTAALTMGVTALAVSTTGTVCPQNTDHNTACSYLDANNDGVCDNCQNQGRHSESGCTTGGHRGHSTSGSQSGTHHSGRHSGSRC